MRPFCTRDGIDSTGFSACSAGSVICSGADSSAGGLVRLVAFRVSRPASLTVRTFRISSPQFLVFTVYVVSMGRLHGFPFGDLLKSLPDAFHSFGSYVPLWTFA